MPVVVPVVVVVVVDMAVVVVVDVVVVVEPVFIVGTTAADSFSFSLSLSALSSDQYLLVRLVEPVRVEEEPRLESRPRWPVGEVTDEEVEVVVEEEVVEELKSSCRLPNEPLKEEESPVRRNLCKYC